MISEEKQIEEKQPEETPEVDLKPKKPAKLCAEGIRTFTVCRINDESGVSGTGVVIEGITLATGQCVVHWLYPPPRGGIAIFDSMSDFVKVHIEPHPANQTIITYQDGTKDVYGEKPEEDKEDNIKNIESFSKIKTSRKPKQMKSFSAKIPTSIRNNPRLNNPHMMNNPNIVKYNQIKDKYKDLVATIKEKTASIKALSKQIKT